MRLDSITTNLEAERPHTFDSSSTLAKFSSSKTLNDSSNEPPLKPIKPDIASSTSSRDLAPALRDSGGSSEIVSSKETTTKVEKVSLKDFITTRSFLKSTILPLFNRTLSLLHRLLLSLPPFSSPQFTTSSATVTPAPPFETPRFAIPAASSSSRLVPSSFVQSNLVSSTSFRTLSSSAINSPSSNSPRKKKGEPGWKKFDLQESLKRPMTWKTHLTAARSPFSSVSNVPSTPVPNEQSTFEKLASLPSASTTTFLNLVNNLVKSKGAATTEGRKLVLSTTKKARSGKSQLTTFGMKIEGLETKARKIRAVRRGGPSSGK
ncbi:hypothetical protein JCM5350_007926 [Sporobolomyces pararoseus]